MSVEFLNNNFNVNTVRPTGYKFPVGLNQDIGGDVRKVFGTTQSFTIPTGVTSIDYLVVAGGGGGGTNPGGTPGGTTYNGTGGGGAGGFRTGTVAVTPGASMTITVGAGGSFQAIN